MTIALYLEDDHRRLDALLKDALKENGKIDREAYDEFRRGLLRHIGIEESILFPTVQKSLGAVVLEYAAKLRLDHGALAALLVLDPDAKIIQAVRTILIPHNIMEEGPPGVYAICERVLDEDAASILEQIGHVTEPPLAVRKQSNALRDAAKRSLERAGFPASLLD
jgi:hemerythrin superfamily protein